MAGNVIAPAALGREIERGAWAPPRLSAVRRFIARGRQLAPIRHVPPPVQQRCGRTRKPARRQRQPWSLCDWRSGRSPLPLEARRSSIGPGRSSLVMPRRRPARCAECMWRATAAPRAAVDVRAPNRRNLALGTLPAAVAAPLVAGPAAARGPRTPVRNSRLHSAHNGRGCGKRRDAREPNGRRGARTISVAVPRYYSPNATFAPLTGPPNIIGTHRGSAWNANTLWNSSEN